MQKPFEDIVLNPFKRHQLSKIGQSQRPLIVEFGEKFVESCKEFVGSDRDGLRKFIVNFCKDKKLPAGNKPTSGHIAGRGLLACAIGTTLAGNFITLSDFNKGRGSNSSLANSVIDNEKEKVVC